MGGREICDIHGGRRGVGIAAPGFKHGGLSKALPARYLRAYTAALRDPDYTSLRTQIAALKSREEELALRMSTGESGASWAAAAELIAAHQRGVPNALEALSTLISTGVGDEQQWTEFRSNAELLRRLQETEHKHMTTAQAYLTAEEIGVCAGFFAAMLRRYVTDPQQLRAAGGEMAAFFDVWRVGPMPNLGRAERDRQRARDAANGDHNDEPTIDAEVVESESVVESVVGVGGV